MLREDGTTRMTYTRDSHLHVRGALVWKEPFFALKTRIECYFVPRNVNGQSKPQIDRALQIGVLVKEGRTVEAQVLQTPLNQVSEIIA